MSLAHRSCFMSETRSTQNGVLLVGRGWCSENQAQLTAERAADQGQILTSPPLPVTLLHPSLVDPSFLHPFHTLSTAGKSTAFVSSCVLSISGWGTGQS